MTPLWKSLLAALVALPLIAFGLGSALADSGERGDRSPVVIEVDEDLGGTSRPSPTTGPSPGPSPSGPAVRPAPQRTTEPGVRVVKPKPAPVPRDDDDDDDDDEPDDDGDDDD